MDGGLVVGLYRHGATLENLAGKYIGWYDAILAESEIDRLLARRGVCPEYDLIIMSDLARCRETAAVLFPGKPVLATSSLREIHFGHWETKTYQDLRENREYQEWLNDQSLPIPGGESRKEFENRLNGFCSDLLRDSHDPEFVERYNLGRRDGILRIALVTHGGVIRQLMTKWTGEAKGFWEWKTPYGEGYELRWTEEKWRAGGKCNSYMAVPIMENQNG